MRDGERPLVVVVPRTGLEACESLRRALGEDSTVQVIVDRRFGERRVRAEPGRPEQRRGGRRRRSDVDVDFKAGRWIAVARADGHIDLGDPDARAILVLCCSQHVIPCGGCQDTYRLGWIARAGTGAVPCPRCGGDLTRVVAAHAQSCRYWVDREAGAEQRELPARAATS